MMWRAVVTAALAVLLAAGLCSSIAPGAGAHATVVNATSPAYLDTLYDTPLWNEVEGGAWPDAFPASWAAGSIEDAAVAGGGMPPIALSFGTIALGLGAFDVGWKIGRTIDTKWLHLEGNIGNPSTNTTVSANLWCDYGGICMNTGTNMGAADNAAYNLTIDHDLVLYERTVGCYSAYGDQVGGESVIPFAASWSIRSGCVVAMQNAWSAIPASNPGTIVTVPASDSVCQRVMQIFYRSPSGGHCELRIWRERDIDAALVHGIPVTWAGQVVNKTTNIAAPTKTDATLKAIRDVLTAAGIAVQNEINNSLDPSDYERPGTNGAPPGGYRITWPEPLVTETYDQYISRLQALGYAGAITKVTLGEDNGDSEYATSGVPCTSVIGGSSIGADDPATIYQNPTTFGSGGDPDPNSPGCFGRLDTSQYGGKCEFNDVSWATQTASDPDRYQTICWDAWGYFWANQTFVDESTGVIHDMDQVRFMDAGGEMVDSELISKLKAIDPDLSHWIKARTFLYGGYDHPFEVHFYYNSITNTIPFNIDWKLKFVPTF